MTSSFSNSSTYGRPDDLQLLPKNNDLVTPLLTRLLNLCTVNGTENHIVDIIRAQPYVNKYKRFHDPKLGNYVIKVGESRTIFSCHMDIVGSNSKEILAQNKVEKIFLCAQPESLKNTYGIIWGAKANVDDKGKITKYIPSTLGADDKVGVYILLKMIEAGIPGTYLFHTGEECGGVGSKYLSTNHKELFENIDRAIAFDRAGYNDIIGFQRGSRCCSTEFGKAFAIQLNEFMPPKIRFKEDIHGTFTDTANYTSLVPECTNVSVGYFNQHGSGEHLDVYFLDTWLLPAILKVKYEELPVKRDPKVTTYSTNYSSNYGKYNANTPKKDWKDTTVKTPYLEFPLWKPELGIPEGASKEVLIMAISRFLGTCSYGKERDAFCAWLVDSLVYTNMLEEDNAALNAAILMQGGKKANPPDVILLPPPEYYQKKEGTTPVNTYLEDKISLLTRLVVVSDRVILTNGEDQLLLNQYNNGAKKLLTKLADKTDISEKKVAKCNRIIFALGNLIDTAAVLSKDEESLLMAVEKHICETHSEEGWWGEFKKVNDKQAASIH